MANRNAAPTRRTVPDTTPASAPANPAKYVFALFIDENGNRTEFGREDIRFDNEKWQNAVAPTLKQPKPKLRPVDRFWIHESANGDDPIWFDDTQLIAEASRLIHFSGISAEEAAKKLHFKADWFVVAPVTYQNSDRSTFVKNEPVEIDGQWLPATKEEIEAGLAEKANPA